MRTAAHPFLFVGCVELRQTLDMHALDERELMHRVAEVPADSVFFHTFGYFLRHRPFTTAYGNDLRGGPRSRSATARSPSVWPSSIRSRCRPSRRCASIS